MSGQKAVPSLLNVSFFIDAIVFTGSSKNIRPLLIHAQASSASVSYTHLERLFAGIDTF